jgi:hypothetical protein
VAWFAHMPKGCRSAPLIGLHSSRGCNATQANALKCFAAYKPGVSFQLFTQPVIREAPRMRQALYDHVTHYALSSSKEPSIPRKYMQNINNS